MITQNRGGGLRGWGLASAFALAASFGVGERALGQTAPAVDQATLLSKHSGQVPSDMEVVGGAASKTDPTNMFYLVHKVSAVTGKDLRTAKQTLDELNLPAVSFTLNSEGVEIIASSRSSK